MKGNITKHIFRHLAGRHTDKAIEIFVTLVAGGSFILILTIFIFITREAAPVIFGSPAEFSVVPGQEIGYEVYNVLPGEANIVPAEGEAGKAGTYIFSEEEQRQPAKVSAWRSVFETVWDPVAASPIFGMLPLILGTLKTTFVALCIAAPISIFAAIYSAFFAPRPLREALKPAIELLAGMPTVVIGFFCLTILGGYLRTIFGTDYYLSSLLGGIGLSIAIIPIIFTISEDSLTAVPAPLREASLALGASEWQTIGRVMLPAAFPGIFAALLLGVGRAFGETMILLMATGNSPMLSFNLLDPARTIAATIGAETGEVIWGSSHYHILFFLGFLLFIFTFILNAVSLTFIRNRIQKRFFGTV